MSSRETRRASSSSSSNASQASKTEQPSAGLRPRAGYLRTDPRPEGTRTSTELPKDWKKITVTSNFVEIKPHQGYPIYMYRFDFSPIIESVPLRRRLVDPIRKEKFRGLLDFDGMSDGRSIVRIDDTFEVVVQNPTSSSTSDLMTVTVKRVGEVDFGSFEMLRSYNMKMKSFFDKMGFFQTQRGVYVHPDLSTPIPNESMRIVRGFLTAANTHENGKVLMNMESVHKIIQDKSVLEMMTDIRNYCQGRGENFTTKIRLELAGKMIVPSYENKICYKVEDVAFDVTPMSTFDKRDGSHVSFIDYFRDRYGKDIKEKKQPMLLVTKSNRSRRERERELAEAAGDVQQTKLYVPPELCCIAGLTTEQRNNQRLKMTMIRATQLSPKDRVDHLQKYLDKLRRNEFVRKTLDEWKYDYDRLPTKLEAKRMPVQKIKCSGQPANVEDDGGFDKMVIRSKLAVAPKFETMSVVVPEQERNAYAHSIEPLLKRSFQQIGLSFNKLHRQDIQDSNGETMHKALSGLPQSDLVLVVMSRIDKKLYDVIKKWSIKDKGVPTQVLTSRLMTDDRKKSGAATKIGIQIAAKLGGEPWHINVPMKKAMICGYDTHHNSINRGSSYGAFVASTNGTYSRWWSKVDSHSRLEEISTNLKTNLVEATRNWAALNGGQLPDRIIIYRDGVGDGQLEHVFKLELKDAKREIRKLSSTIRLTMIIVNKRVNARFYMHTPNGGYANPPPGTVIDSVVTRPERYDFYLVSPSTRQGTISPTYYNVIYDESGIPTEHLQTMTYRLCFNYYNWTGSVRVPAPCQYAHKLAFISGEHVHDVPHANLANLLHFL